MSSTFSKVSSVTFTSLRELLLLSLKTVKVFGIQDITTRRSLGKCMHFLNSKWSVNLGGKKHLTKLPERYFRSLHNAFFFCNTSNVKLCKIGHWPKDNFRTPLLVCMVASVAMSAPWICCSRYSVYIAMCCCTDGVKCWGAGLMLHGTCMDGCYYSKSWWGYF